MFDQAIPILNWKSGFNWLLLLLFSLSVALSFCASFLLIRVLVPQLTGLEIPGAPWILILFFLFVCLATLAFAFFLGITRSRNEWGAEPQIDEGASSEEAAAVPSEVAPPELFDLIGLASYASTFGAFGAIGMICVSPIAGIEPFRPSGEFFTGALFYLFLSGLFVRFGDYRKA